jgi:hypothetical protein
MQRQKCIVVENAVELSNGEKRRTDEKIEQRSTIRSDLPPGNFRGQRDCLTLGLAAQVRTIPERGARALAGAALFA